MVVTKLVELGGGVGEATRRSLLELGAEPEELVDGIVSTLERIVKVIVEEWGAADGDDSGEAIVKAGQVSKGLMDAIRQAIKQSPLTKKLLDVDQVQQSGVGEEERRQLRMETIVIRVAEAISQFAEYWVFDPSD